MNIARLRQARRLFDIEGVPRSTVRHNIRGWARSIRFLGNNWLLAQRVEKMQ